MRIEVCGAQEHNLSNVDVEIGDGLTVVTGVSGSGKTSLVFDTIYHEARRRFMEVFGGSLRLAPAQVRSITGLGPAVAVGQNLLNRNPASTLATASGLHPFFRLLYARFGKRHCARCGAGLEHWTEDEIVERIRKGPLEQACGRMIADSRRRMTHPEENQPSKLDDLTFVAFRPRVHRSAPSGRLL